MGNTVAHTLMITSRCSGGCLPCPFGQGSLPQRYLGTQDVVEAVCLSSAPLVVITGGEPLEHPNFEEIVAQLTSASQSQACPPFRIATGGHRNLEKIIPILQNCTAFEGFSLGSDVLSAASIHVVKHAPIWAENVRQLNANLMSYSLTMTLHDNRAELDPLMPLRKAAKLGAKPDFIYLRHSETNETLTQIYKDINKIFENTRILCESL